MPDHNEKRDLAIGPGSYCYMQDMTTGAIKTYVGPCVVNQTGQERPVVYNPSDDKFTDCLLNDAEQPCIEANEGEYVVLSNPVADDEIPHPQGAGKTQPPLRNGRRINISGPCMFALWPRQKAKVIPGHQMRSNQYLLIQVYNEEAAKKNWMDTVAKPATDSEDTAPITQTPPDLTVGKPMIIKGTDVSFYIPPTGIEVVGNDMEEYVREAMTLERLEYCILEDEDGNKRYEKGPQVVFPEPTEIFSNLNGRTKFKCVELNAIQGLYIKVIAPYTENGKEYKEGEELFITGKEQAIYVPRAEHSLVKYDGKAKHFATAIPVGEGRYLLNRMTGHIESVKGPAMLLPDPRTEVIVRRMISSKQCQLWYPGNHEALNYNMELAAMLQNTNVAPTTRAGAISDGEYTRSAKKRGKLDRGMNVANLGQASPAGDEFSRASTYTQPRTLTLDTKYHGIPRIDVWEGYAVMIVSPTGKREVVLGPKTILLNYEESLQVLELSTGKPKNTDQLHRTVYLNIADNYVTDVIDDIETSDHVRVTVKLSNKVNFEGDPNNWFRIENYVKHLCDHVRSVLKGAVKQISIKDFYKDPTSIIRNTILGQKADGETSRPGMGFSNDMRIHDVEVLKVKIQDERVQGLLESAQHGIVKANIELSNARHDLETTREMEDVRRAKVEVEMETQRIFAKINREGDRINHETKMAQLHNSETIKQFHRGQEVADLEHRSEQNAREIANNQAVHDAKIVQRRADLDLDVSNLNAQTEAVCKQIAAISPEFKVAITQFTEAVQLKSLVDGFGEYATIHGQGVAQSAKEILDLLPQNLRFHIDPSGNGRKHLTD